MIIKYMIFKNLAYTPLFDEIYSDTIHTHILWLKSQSSLNKFLTFFELDLNFGK